MRMLSLIFTLLVVGNTAVTAWGADLTKIDRKIAKEPAYQNKPKYCLLVFGPEAKFRVWLVRDGEVLYVDTNGNGDLTEDGERKRTDGLPGHTVRTWQIGTITDPRDKTKYTDLKVRLRMDKEIEIAVQVPFGNKQLSLSTGRAYAYHGLLFADRPEEAPIVHLGGPLTMMVGKPPQVLVRGRTWRVELARIGTPGQGRGTFAMVEVNGPGWNASQCGVAISSEQPGLVELRFTDAKGKEKVALEKLTYD